MAIGNDLLFEDTFDRANDESSMGVNWTYGGNGNPEFGILDNSAYMSWADESGYKGAWLVNALPTSSANLAVETRMPGNGRSKMVMFRGINTNTTAPNVYGLGHWGTNCIILRHDASASSTDLASTYSSLLEATDAPFVRVEIETVGSDVSLKVLLKPYLSPGDPWTTVATYTDSSADKLLGIGNTGIMAWYPYFDGGAVEHTWEYFRVYGTSNAGSSIPVFSQHLKMQGIQ